VSPGWDFEDPAPATPRPAPPAPPPPPIPETPPRRQWLEAVLYVLAGVLVLAVVFASFNPAFGFFQKEQGYDALHWPWDTFRGEDGPMWRWLPPHAFLLAMVPAGLALIMAAFLRAGRLRTGLALVAFVLVGVACMPSPGSFMVQAGTHVALAVLLGGVLALRAGGLGAGDASGGARRTAWLGWIALALFLLFPYVTPFDRSSDPNMRPQYSSAVTEPVRSLAHVLRDPTPLIERPGEDARPITLWDWVRLENMRLSLLLAAAVGLWAVLARGRGGSVPLLALLLLAALIGPAIELGLRAVGEFRITFAEGPQTEVLAREQFWGSIGQVLLASLRVALLPLALGLADLLRLPRRA
jgi:hypothetical protein